jgi:hypothetical protein
MNIMERQNDAFTDWIDEVSEFIMSDTGNLYFETLLREHPSLLEIAARVMNDKVNEAYIIRMDVYSGQSTIGEDVPADLEQEYNDKQFLNQSN